MTPYNTLSLKLSHIQLNKLKWGIQNGIEVNLNLTSSVIGGFNDDTSCAHKYLSANTQVLRLRKDFASNSSASTKLSKTQLSKIGQSGGSLGRLLGPLLRIGSPLMKNVPKILAKNVFILLGLTATASAIDEATQKKMIAPCKTILVISNKKMNDFMKIIKCLQNVGLLIKSVSKAIKHEAKEQEGGFLSILLGTLGVI